MNTNQRVNYMHPIWHRGSSSRKDNEMGGTHYLRSKLQRGGEGKKKKRESDIIVKHQSEVNCITGTLLRLADISTVQLGCKQETTAIKYEIFVRDP